MFKMKLKNSFASFKTEALALPTKITAEAKTISEPTIQYVDRIVEIVKEVPTEIVREVLVPYETIVEKIKEVPVYIDREVEKIVERPVEVVKETTSFIDRIVVRYKTHPFVMLLLVVETLVTMSLLFVNIKK